MHNKATLVGRLGKDPELTYTQAGTARCRFSMATSDTYRDKAGEKREDTEWHNIIVWGKSAENSAKYLKKGKLVLVEGKITTRSWDDEKTGQKRYITEIKAFIVRFLGGDGKRDDGNRRDQDKDRGGRDQGSGNRGGGQSGGGQGGGGGPDDDDSIPF